MRPQRVRSTCTRATTARSAAGTRDAAVSHDAATGGRQGGGGVHTCHEVVATGVVATGNCYFPSLNDGLQLPAALRGGTAPLPFLSRACGRSETLSFSLSHTHTLSLALSLALSRCVIRISYYCVSIQHQHPHQQSEQQKDACTVAPRIHSVALSASSVKMLTVKTISSGNEIHTNTGDVQLYVTAALILNAHLILNRLAYPLRFRGYCIEYQ